MVEITARTSNAERSQAIAQTTANVYLGELNRRVEENFGPEIEELIEELDDIEDGIDDANDRLFEASEPFRNQIDDPTLDSPLPIPSAAVLDPVADTQRSTLTAERGIVLSRLDALETASENAVNSETLQQAELPEEPLGNALAPLRWAFAVVFALLGVAVALVATRFSRSVLDDRDIETALRRPIEARLPRSSALSGNLRDALDIAPSEANLIDSLDRLASRIELASDIRGARVIGVGGSQENSGSSTVAVALAARFSQRGNRTILVDADATDARVTYELGAPPMLHRTDFESATAADYGETIHGNLITLGIDQADRTRRIRSTALGRGLRARTDIIVIDLGPLLASTSASQLMDELDLVVVSFPKHRQPNSGLEQIARSYSAVTDKMLPVISDVPASRRGKTSGSSRAVPALTAPGPANRAIDAA